jgi:homoserine kinase
MALDLYNEVEIDTEASPNVAVEGEGAGELPLDASNLIFRAMAYLTSQTGAALPPFAMRCVNRIPLERGLGSSSAAVVAGVVLADALGGTELTEDRLLQIAVDVEGHADNVSPALRGGCVVAYLSRDGWRAERIPVSADLRPVVLVPLEERMPTSEARRVLPLKVPREDAWFNAGRAALLTIALTGREDLLAEALEDKLHQQVRLPLVPGARAVFQELRDRGIPVCVSGAGPSLLAFETSRGAVLDPGPGWIVHRLSVSSEGATVQEVSA